MVSAGSEVERLIPGLQGSGGLLPRQEQLGVQDLGRPTQGLGVQERHEGQVGMEQVPPDPCRYELLCPFQPICKGAMLCVTPAALISSCPQGLPYVCQGISPGSSGVDICWEDRVR